MDPILLSVMHTLVLTHHYSPGLLRIDSPIPTQLIISSLMSEFSVRVEETQTEVVFEDWIGFREEREYVFVRVLGGDTMESTNSTGGVLGDLSAIEEKREEAEKGEGEKGEGSPRREILKCLSTIRRCDSLFAHTDREEMAEGQKTAR